MLRLAAVTLALVLALAATAAAKPLVHYTLTGGIRGEHTELKVSRDGAARVQSNVSESRRWTLSERKLRRLKRSLREADFDSLKRRYVPKVIVADGITETVTHRGKTVTTSTGGDPPPRLEQLLERLRRLAS